LFNRNHERSMRFQPGAPKFTISPRKHVRQETTTQKEEFQGQQAKGQKQYGHEVAFIYDIRSDHGLLHHACHLVRVRDGWVAVLSFPNHCFVCIPGVWSWVEWGRAVVVMVAVVVRRSGGCVYIDSAAERGEYWIARAQASSISKTWETGHEDSARAN
jgi:hypothetical protein